MALTIVRNDIVKMKVDAIVNSTNESLTAAGVGVDAAIHHAAGPQLQDALRRIGYCATGSAVITESFDISTCRYIIHTVGPVYYGGSQGEADKLRDCYRSILRLAHEYHCQSLAIPSISSGAYTFPKEEAYRIATSAIREYLFSLPDDEDIMVYLVLFDKVSVRYGGKIDGEVKEYIADTYPHEKKQFLEGFSQGSHMNRPAAIYEEEIAYEDVFQSEFGSAPDELEEQEDYADQDLSFAEMCEWWCEQKGISKKQFYVSANINRSMFWNMKHHPDQTPKKTNVLACAVGLRLDYDQTLDLLMRAGMTLSPYYALDLAVGEFIRDGNYDIDDINEKLFEQDLALLGAYG